MRSQPSWVPPAFASEIIEALKRPQVPDAERHQASDEALAASVDMFGPGAVVRGSGRQRDDEIRPPIAGGRRTPAIRNRLIAELDDRRREVRRRAANALGAWAGDHEVVDALRRALDNDDGHTRACAARSLGHLGDDDPATWTRTIELAREATDGPTEVAEAIVMLARLDPTARADAGSRAVADLCRRFPAHTRRLTGLAAAISRV